MRWLLALMLVAVAPTEGAASTSHHCSAPLIVPTNGSGLPMPELEFALTLADQNTDARAFMAHGQSFDGVTFATVRWTGSWIRYAGVLRMIGTAQARTAQEWRARTVREEESVMILNVDQGNVAPLMVRCLPMIGN